MATSEALAYAVDEAVQVFGGNGYSREFPVERAYRDARITRIYEGTNEINRLIIPTRLLKHGESLLAQEVRAEASGSVLEAERQALADVKRLAQTALAAAAQAFGAAVRDQQEVLAHAADVIIECYAIESALGRAEKMTARGSERARDCRGHRARLHERCDGPRGPRRQADRECAGRTRRADRASSAPPSPV